MDREHIKLAGVGRRLTHKLNALGIKTALDLCQSDVQDIRRQFSVVLARTVSEIQGTSCLAGAITPEAFTHFYRETHDNLFAVARINMTTLSNLQYHEAG